MVSPEQLRGVLDQFEHGNFDPFLSLLAPDVRWDGWPSGHLWWRRTPT